MSTKGGLIFLITSIVIVLAAIIALIGIYYFDWLKPAGSGYALYTATPDDDARFVIRDSDEQSADVVTHIPQTDAPASQNVPSETPISQSAQTHSETVDASQNDNAVSVAVGNPQKKYTYYTLTETDSDKSDKAVKNTNNGKASDADKSVKSVKVDNAGKQAVSHPVQTDMAAAHNESKTAAPAKTASGNPVAPKHNMPAPKFTKTEAVTKQPAVGKDGSPIKIGFTFDKTRDFHSYGQYVSADEYKYRLAVINNLKIKTIVIDAVSKGNGISQEYYKVAYNENMIPAKILDEITTSKEFRRLIPKQYLDIEDRMTAFPKGGKVTFSNTDMKELLILWSQGKLTPTQKAWQVRATL